MGTWSALAQTCVPGLVNPFSCLHLQLSTNFDWRILPLQRKVSIFSQDFSSQLGSRESSLKWFCTSFLWNALILFYGILLAISWFFLLKWYLNMMRNANSTERVMKTVSLSMYAPQSLRPASSDVSLCLLPEIIYLHAQYICSLSCTTRYTDCSTSWWCFRLTV